jgi:hypothetical protein
MTLNSARGARFASDESRQNDGSRLQVRAEHRKADKLPYKKKQKSLSRKEPSYTPTPKYRSWPGSTDLKGAKMIRTFLSFVEEDLDRVNLFRGQARNKNFDLEFADYSVREPYNSANADYIKQQIAKDQRI